MLPPKSACAAAPSSRCRPDSHRTLLAPAQHSPPFLPHDHSVHPQTLGPHALALALIPSPCRLPPATTLFQAPARTRCPLARASFRPDMSPAPPASPLCHDPSRPNHRPRDRPPLERVPSRKLAATRRRRARSLPARSIARARPALLALAAAASSRPTNAHHDGLPRTALTTASSTSTTVHNGLWTACRRE